MKRRGAGRPEEKKTEEKTTRREEDRFEYEKND